MSGTVVVEPGGWWQIIAQGSAVGFFFSFLLGAVLGSFANVVIQRLPRGDSIIRPASRCPSCGAPIPSRYNIPLLSYFFLRGRAACCGDRISARYPMIEWLCALLLLSLYLKNGWTFGFLFEGGWMILLVILAAIDLYHYRLPNVLVGIGFGISLLWMIVDPQQSWQEAGSGLLVAGVFALILLGAGKYYTGEIGGMGDVKLLMVLGFTLGFGRFLQFIVVAMMSALLFAILFRKKLPDQRIPLGPAFAFGTWVTFWLGDAVIPWYLSLWGL
jgi:leader peptidase (prepilin peptidase)/N-methyltransferase